MNLKDHDIEWKRPHAKDSVWNVIYRKWVDREHLHRNKERWCLYYSGLVVNTRSANGHEEFWRCGDDGEGLLTDCDVDTISSTICKTPYIHNTYIHVCIYINIHKLVKLFAKWCYENQQIEYIQGFSHIFKKHLIAWSSLTQNMWTFGLLKTFI